MFNFRVRTMKLIVEIQKETKMNRLIFQISMLLMLAFFGSGVNGQATKFTQAIYLFQIPEEKSNQLQFKQARAISVDLSGMLYICDTGNNTITKLNSNGEIIESVGGFGWEKEMFYTPYDIYASSALDVFVADYNNNRIQRYDKDLNYISSLHSDEDWDDALHFGYPKSVANSIHGDLLVLDGENNRLIKFNSFGEPEISFGDFGEGKGRLLDPIQIAVSQDDKIFVSDAAQNKILVFDYFGNYLSEIGTNYLKEPQGIFFSSTKMILVADQGNKRIAAFDPNGNVIIAWSKISDKMGSFLNPMDVASFNDLIYVLDADRILVFELK